MNGAPDDIRTLLDQAAAFGIAPARALTPETDEDAWGFVLSGIRTCVLPRLLEFTVDGCPALRLSAAGGRLQTLVGIGPDSAAEPFRDLTAQPLGPGDAERIAALLRSLFRAGQRIGLVSRPAGAATEQTRHGLAAQDVQDMLNLVPLAPDPATRCDLLLASAEEVLIALHRGDGQTEILRKGVTMPDALVASLDLALDPVRGRAGLVGPDEILFFAPLPDLPFGAGLFHAPEGPAALVVARDALSDLARFWTELPAMYGPGDS